MAGPGARVLPQVSLSNKPFVFPVRHSPSSPSAMRKNQRTGPAIPARVPIDPRPGLRTSRKAVSSQATFNGPMRRKAEWIITSFAALLERKVQNQKIPRRTRERFDSPPNQATGIRRCQSRSLGHNRNSKASESAYADSAFNAPTGTFYPSMDPPVLDGPR